MTVQIVPVTNIAVQNFDFSIVANGNNFNFHFNIRYNNTAHYWIMQISDRNTQEIILDSIPLLTSPNLLGQLEYLRIGKAYIKNISNTNMDSPDITNLGKDFQLIWDDND
jgi:predicted Zn-dependent protease with MMP-like domain